MRVLIKVQRLSKRAKLPVKAKVGDACYDICANDWVEVRRGKVEFVSTGLKVSVPYGYELQIRPRSGLAKEGLVVVNSPGTVDSGYIGEVKIMLTLGAWARVNAMLFKPGERIAQIKVSPVPATELVEVESMTNTDRGEGGFGSTGL